MIIFKQEAIEFAWEFLTSDKWMGMEPDKLYVTIPSGRYGSIQHLA
ncbi:hypothetical protein ACVNP1_09475 [Staphylococcus aureus]